MQTKNEKPKNTRSLTTSLALGFFGLSVFVLLLSSSLQIFLNIQAQQSALSNRQILIAQEAGKSVSDFIQNKFNTLETALSFADPITASPEARNTIMEGMLGINPAFRQFAVISRQGRQLGQISRISPSLSSQFSAHISDNNLFNQISQDQYYLSPIYIDDETSEPLIVMAIPVNDVLGKFEGTLVAEVNLKFMWDLVDQIKVGSTGYAYVVDSGGNLIAYRDTALVLQGKNVNQISKVNQFTQNPTSPADTASVERSYTGLNGTAVVGTYVPLETPEWAVVVELPWREAYQGVILLIIRSLITILVIALVASLVGVFVARQLASPIIKLSYTANEVAKGNLNTQAEVTGAKEITQLAGAFNTMITQLRDLVGNLENRVNERTAQLETANAQTSRRAAQLQVIAEVARFAASIQDLDTLLNSLAGLISERFGYYHVGIFLLDEQNQHAILEASNTEGGLRMLKRRHQLRVGEQGIVGFVTLRGEPRIALDVGADAAFFDNPDLPNTRSELALPLKISEKIIGALDLQSLEESAFHREDVSILAILADQVAIAIQNARSVERAKHALIEAEIATKRVSGEAWKEYAEKRQVHGYRYDGIRPEPLSNRGTSFDEKDALLVPVQLRGQTIARLKLKASESTRKWSDDERAMIESTAERVAIAMESARLLEEAQKRATRESFLSEIGTKLGGSFQLDSILRDTVEELGQTLKGSTVSFQLVNPSPSPTVDTPKTDRDSTHKKKPE